MAAFGSLDKRLRRDLDALHDTLWQGRKGSEEALVKGIVAEAGELDAFLRTGNRLRKNAAALAKAWDHGAHGASMFELIHDAYHLTAATEHVAKEDYKGAGEHVAWAVESMSIGLCSALSAFNIVEAWERQGGDYEAYTSRIADLLQLKGVERAGEYKRILLAARTFGKEFDKGAAPEAQAIGAQMAVAQGAWLGVTTHRHRRKLGVPPAYPFADYAAVLQRIVARV